MKSTEIKITVIGVAKLTFTILLGYKIGKALAEVPGSLCEAIIEASEDKIEKAITGKLKEKKDILAEVDEKLAEAKEELDKMEEGESEG